MVAGALPLLLPAGGAAAREGSNKMPTAIREQIMTALAAKLGEIAAVTVRRNPDTPAEALPTIDLFDTGGQEPGQQGGGIEEYFLEVPIDLFAADGPALNEIEAKAWAKLAANTGLGGLSIDIARLKQEDGAIDTQQGHPTAIGRPMPVRIHYWTREGDPYAVGP